MLVFRRVVTMLFAVTGPEIMVLLVVLVMVKILKEAASCCVSRLI